MKTDFVIAALPSSLPIHWGSAQPTAYQQHNSFLLLSPSLLSLSLFRSLYLSLPYLADQKLGQAIRVARYKMSSPSLVSTDGVCIDYRGAEKHLYIVLIFYGNPNRSNRVGGCGVRGGVGSLVILHQHSSTRTKRQDNWD